MSDSIKNSYYHGTKVMEFIEEFQLGFCLGNTVKYIARNQEKGTPLEDLKKALWYLDREIAQMEKVVASYGLASIVAENVAENVAEKKYTVTELMTMDVCPCCYWRSGAVVRTSSPSKLCMECLAAVESRGGNFVPLKPLETL
jgi:hypothetical protein